MMRFPVRRLTAAACALMLSCAAAQTSPPAKPPAKPAAKPPSIVVPPSKASTKAPAKSLGGQATPSGKMLSKEELRQCLARLDQINKSGKEIDGLRSTLDAERTELTQQGDALKTEYAEVQTRMAAVQEYQVRVRAHGQDVEAFNKRMAALPEVSRTQREAVIKELEAERVRLTQARDVLASEEARVVPPYQSGAASYNERAGARDAKVADWNKRNASAVETSKKHDDERTAWLGECANRPYREDDEIAIKKGQ